MFDFFKNQPKPITQINSEIDQEDENNPLLKLTLSCNASSSSSSLSPPSRVSEKKRNRHQEDVTSNPIKKAKSSKSYTLLGSQESWLRLSMGPPDMFVIKKTLEESDTNNLARLMLSKSAVEELLTVYFDEDMKRRLKDKEGLAVRVWDKDCDVVLNMKMKIWGSSGSLIMNDRWINKFVKRRGLKRGDQIGLYWDSSNSRFVFSLLRKAPIDATMIS